MKKYLITPSLLQSFDYFMNYSEDEARAKYSQDENLTANVKTDAEIREEFLQTLRREKSEPNEAMQKGIDFENAIEAYTQAKFMASAPQASEVVKEIGDIVAGGLWQQKCQKEIEANGVQYLLYGKMDVIKHDWIYDIKFVTKTANYELGKFLNYSQHKIYMLCTGLKKFAYLVSDGKNVWREEYKATVYDEATIKHRIRTLRRYLRNDAEAEKLFLENWEFRSV